MFTSRLPISTSVRRPTNHHEGSTSFVGINRPSHIPVTVRKVNLFTPQTKKPYMNGTSTAGKSYMSVMTTDKKKYQRPLKPMPDRDLQLKMFDTLVDFLKTNAPHLPLPEAKKFFSSVSTTESSRIFEFLIGRILPDFKINRLETDVPEALALLDYPYIRSVTKSALVSVTTRQAAVGLLVIFYWLINCINQIEDPKDELEDCNEMSELYKSILMQPDKVGEVSRRRFEESYPTENYEGLMNNLEETVEEIDAINRYLAEIDDVVLEATTLEEDIQRCAEYRVQMEKYLQVKADEEDDIKQQSLRTDIQNEERAKRKEHFLSEIQRHELNIEDVRRNQAIVNNLESKLNSIRRQADELALQRDQTEKKYQKLLSMFREVNNENLNHMKKLLHTYSSQQDVDSEHWAERKLEIREWILKLEQLPYDDLAQNQRLQHEQSLFMQKLSATSMLLQSEIRASMTDKKFQLESSEAENDKYQREILPRLREASYRIQGETEDETRHCMDNLSRINVQSEEEDQHLKQLKDKAEQAEAAIIRERNLELQRLAADKQEITSFIELSMKHLKTALDRNHQQALSIVKEAEREANRFNEARNIVEENYKTSKNSCRILKRRLNLS